ncbi:S-methyl-5-thioribose-1-phosphate isomerase [Magnetospirillum fulvum]|uniref:Methylthioribose-1-phosphate isomerase n=1 Tax=Magnetospirillum fulvum TaxID=1082 RepID=A0A1H6GZN1_MAGFU|nr:S-methyl-5-thioribose-1-phosphate isomerase [Magnetospirillum fulvum]SEH28831.1 methylthioribose-1-phosphate isomerase [Magnetospirillum fulvum]
MKIDGVSYRTIWLAADGIGVEIIDQTRLPHDFVVLTLRSLADAETAIRDMWVRGAPLIGAAAAYGMALATREDASDAGLAAAYARLHATRPTAINLKWALDEMIAALSPLPVAERVAAAYARAAEICDEDVAMNSALGDNGCRIIADLWEKKQAAGGERINLLTHCNAGWLATVDWGTALAPVYKAFNAGIPIHVWVDETRPRNQGASLTARELNWHGVPHTVIADNTGGHLMQHGLVDLVIVGTDRTTRNGDVCNKIGTYLKALAAKDNNVPFYVGLPSPTIDWTVADGVKEIPIEQRSAREQTHIFGKTEAGTVTEVQVTPDGSPAINYGFDVTPARLITGLITERGVCPASPEGLKTLFPERG